MRGSDSVMRRVAKVNVHKKEGRGEGVGLFIPLPPHIVSQFPNGKDGNGGPPHVTFLYIGKVEPEDQADLLEALREVVPQCLRGPVQGRLRDLDYLEHPHENRHVAHRAVEFSQDLAQARDKIKEALNRCGFYPEDSYPVWRPHTTLEYLPGLDREEGYQGDLPEGEWLFDSLEVWDLPEVHEIHLGRSQTLKLSKKTESEKEDEESGRLIRKEPKSKPKRKDRRRDRIKVEDPDLAEGNSGDPDMSLNYKKVGAKELQSVAYMRRHIVGNHGALSPRPYSRKRRCHVREERTPRGERNMPVKVATIKKSAAMRLAADLDKIANFFEHYFASIGVPKKYAHDFAKRCDIFADHVEKFAGAAGGFDAGSIGQAVPGSLVHDSDEEYMSDHFTQVDGEELRDFQEEDGWGSY